MWLEMISIKVILHKLPIFHYFYTYIFSLERKQSCENHKRFYYPHLHDPHYLVAKIQTWLPAQYNALLFLSAKKFCTVTFLNILES